MKQHAPTDRKTKNETATSLIIPYFRENIVPIAMGLTGLILADSFQLYIPRIIKHAVDDITRLTADLHSLGVHGIKITLTALMIAVFRYVWRRCLIGTSRRIEEGLRDRLFSHIQTLSPSYFARVSTGDLMAHATNDITNIRMATGMGMVALIDAVFLGTSTVIFMTWINGRLTLFALLPMPLIVVCARIFSRIMHTRYRDVQGAFSDLTETVRENFAGIRIVKAYTRENQGRDQVERRSKAYVDKNIELIRITGSFFPLMMALSNLSLVIVIYLGGRQTIFGTITAGDLVAFISYLGLLTWPMMALGWMTNLIQRGRASLDRIGLIMNEIPDILDGEPMCPVPEYPVPIVFDSVGFSYRYDGPDILRDISITVKPGMTLGVVGPPGSGKTTLLSLVPRLWDATAGAVRLGETDVREFGVVPLRDRISFMTQEPFLFEGSIRENMAIGNMAADDSLTDDAVVRSSLTKDIGRFVHGWDTLVGEKGVILSGGQKQRVSLARTLLHDRDILIFDDPVSQVDTRTGARIVDTIREYHGKRQVLISSHRLSAVRWADEIIVLDNGRIVERGNHDQLMANNGYYSRTVRLQDMEEKAYDGGSVEF